ncbi:MAG: 3-dehydro-L-gulonate 2-dehydrogenase [Sphaerochaetaceae bacterium]
MRVAYADMRNEFQRVLCKHGMEEQDAILCATLFAQTSLDGVYTHGLNRFPRFIKHVEDGIVDIQARAVHTQSFGSMERWDGKRGPGNLNAYISMQRAIALAKEHTMGCVALSNTNHWMRPGAYGLLAAEADCIGILWTNTIPNMPPWGSSAVKLGNNPVVIAIPHRDCPVLVDVAMSMFSYGKMEAYAHDGRQLPFEGGFDRQGKLTKDPAEILATRQSLPIGYWKGSGLSLALDLVAALLSGGKTSQEIGKLSVETEVSQIFLAFSLANLPNRAALEASLAATLEDLKQSNPTDSSHPVRFPGEGMLDTRRQNLQEGIPVDEAIWAYVRAM